MHMILSSVGVDKIFNNLWLLNIDIRTKRYHSNNQQIGSWRYPKKKKNGEKQSHLSLVLAARTDYDSRQAFQSHNDPSPETLSANFMQTSLQRQNYLSYFGR